MTALCIQLLIAFAVSFAVAWAMYPIVLKVAKFKDLYDFSDARKQNLEKVPRLGGFCFLPAMLFGLMSLLAYDFLADETEKLVFFSHEARTILFYGLSLSAIYAAGVADDISCIRYRTKFAVQAVAAILLICSGTFIDDLYGVCGINELPTWVGFGFTVLMVVFIINAFNLIDGIDGLCSSLFILAGGIYFIVAWLTDDVLSMLIAVLSFGATLPFFRFNMLGHASRGNKLFMGDTGSMTLGLLVTILGMRAMHSVEHLGEPEVNPVIVALSPIIIPCFDVLRVYFFRLRHHRSPFLPDRNHIHHRLMDCGLNARGTLGVLFSGAVVLCVLNFLLSFFLDVNIVLAIDIAVWLLSTRYLRRRQLKNAE